MLAIALFAVAISLQPIVDTLTPIVQEVGVQLVGLIFAIVSAWLVALVSQYTGFRIQQGAVDRLRAAAQTHAGIMIANAADNLRNTSITVSNPLVQEAASIIIANVPQAFAKAGITPEAVARMVVGELGKLQAAHPGVTATATAIAPPDAPVTASAKA